jgi:hypothetical protein
MGHLLCIATIFLLALPSQALAGWDLEKSIIDTAGIQSGGPPKDGIPALFEPKTLPAEWVDFLADDEQVLGVFHNGVARAYPTRILSWHELVNDDFGGDPLLVSW